MSHSLTFRGPLFIVGLSRSGTTLLRNLLNNHKHVSLLPFESHFIPMAVGKFGSPSSLSSLGQRKKLVQLIRETPFWAMTSAKIKFREEDILHEMDVRSWESVLECVCRSFLSDEDTAQTIWGDKTPGYLQHVFMLKRVCPHARFLHIIRDPRDRCLSVNRLWKKSLYRAATQWHEYVEISQQYRNRLGSEYMEVHYEKLIQEPETVLREICVFLELPFQEGMTKLEKPAQRSGDARHKAEIVQDNFGKFMEQLPKRKLKRIEEITFPSMARLGYMPQLAKGYLPIGKIRMGVLVWFDRLSHIRFNIRHAGLLHGLHRAVRIYRMDIKYGKKMDEGKNT